MDFRTAEPPDWLHQGALVKTGVVIFGTGGGGYMLHEFFSRANVPVKAFLDNYKYGRHCLGKPVFQADTGPALIGVSEDTPVIISVVNFSAYGQDNVEACRRRLKEVGWKKVAARPEWSATLFFEHREEIDYVSHLWADEKSRTLFYQALNFLATRAPEYEPPIQAQPYFPSDIPTPAVALRWVQGGAYTGDTLAQAIALGLKIEEAAFFEPDLCNFEQLAVNVRTSGIAASCWPCGLWEKTEALRFNSGRGADSLIGSDGNALIQGVDLDSALPNFKPNLITLDIEGAEIKALEGMKRTIVRNRPYLAISMYHCPDDWWRIPMYVQSLCQNNNLKYKLYFSVHYSAAADALLYAV